MNKNIKRILYISIVLLVLLIGILIVLAATDVIGFGAVIGSVVGFIVLCLLFGGGYFLFFEMRKNKELEEIKKVVEEVKTNEKEALRLIKERLQEPDYADYILSIEDEWTPNLGDSHTPIYIVKAKLEFNMSIMVGMINLVTLKKSIKLYNDFNISREQIEREILSTANLMSGMPKEKKVEKVHRESAITGVSEDIEKPIEKPKEEKKEDEGGDVE